MLVTALPYSVDGTVRYRFSKSRTRKALSPLRRDARAAGAQGTHTCTVDARFVRLTPRPRRAPLSPHTVNIK